MLFVINTKNNKQKGWVLLPKIPHSRLTVFEAQGFPFQNHSKNLDLKYLDCVGRESVFLAQQIGISVVFTNIPITRALGKDRKRRAALQSMTSLQC